MSLQRTGVCLLRQFCKSRTSSVCRRQTLLLQTPPSLSRQRAFHVLSAIRQEERKKRESSASEDPVRQSDNPAETTAASQPPTGDIPQPPPSPPPKREVDPKDRELADLKVCQSSKDPTDTKVNMSAR